MKTCAIGVVTGFVIGLLAVSAIIASGAADA